MAFIGESLCSLIDETLCCRAIAMTTHCLVDSAVTDYLNMVSDELVELGRLSEDASFACAKAMSVSLYSYLYPWAGSCQKRQSEMNGERERERESDF